MRRCQHQVTLAVDRSALLDRIGTPQQEHDTIALVIQELHHAIRKTLPALALVRSRPATLHRQHRIEQQHALGSPTFQVAIGRNCHAQVVRNLLVNVYQRGRCLDTVAHRKTQAMRLSRAVIRVLPQYHHPHLLKRRRVQRVENQRSGWVDDRPGLFALQQEGAQVAHVIKLEFAFQAQLPAGLQADITWFIHIKFVSTT